MFYTFALAWTFTIVIGYNLDTKNVKLFSEPKYFENSRESYFGFSAALYVGVNRRSEDSIILVGAPRANDSAIPSVNEPGVVYKCKINEEECEEWNLDPTGNTPFQIGTVKFNQFKNNSWIGATLGVENNGASQPSAVVCAPRWINKGSSTKNWYMNGMCYYSSIAANGEKFEKLATKRLIPFGLNSTRQYRSNMYDYAYSETGVSLHLHSDKNQIAIMLGNPGILEWRGIPLLFKTINTPIIPEANISYTPRFPIRGNDYFGYSVSSGFYFGGGERWYASGAPRGGYDKTGGVLIFRFPFAAGGIFDKSYLLYGEQLGEYFGSSLTSCDVNNDGRDDIIVGAPFWSKDMDEGRVYIYTTNSKNTLVELFRLDGKSPGARFGSVVTCLGDLDKDGYKDIAIGAPYENDHGAIYIYNGNRKGLNENYRQRIAGESISRNVRGFGGAISEPQDVDGNDYVDIAVGAYLSGQVVLLRSQPVITIQLKIDTDVKQLQPNSTGFELIICSTYRGISVPEEIVFVTTFKMDPLKAYHNNPGIKKRTKGIYDHTSFLYSDESSNCQNYRINLKEDRKNVMESIEIAVSIKPIIQSVGGFCAECPVINEAASKMNQSVTVPFATDCGTDNECNSFLEISSLSSNDLENGTHYTLGSKPVVRLVIGFSNHEEPAYNAQAHIFIPTSISLVRGSHDFQEKITNVDNILEVICNLGNPLRGDTNVILELKMNDVPSDIESLVIFANISTTSQNNRAKILSRNLEIYFAVDADMAIDGKSQQDIDSYLNKDKELLESIRFEHIYEVRKLGVSPIEESVVTVLVPTHWRENEKTSIEIATVNETLGVMQGKTFECSISSRVNEKKIVNGAGISSESMVLENADEDEENQADKSTAAEDFKLKFPPGNRALIINCTNQAFKCSEISCKLGKFENSLTFAKLTITLDLKLRNLPTETMEGKDIIFFVSNGSVIMTQRGFIVKNLENKHIGTLVGTTFVGAPIAKGVAIWVIVVSVLLGIIVLVLLSLGLVKLGFFQRTKREELEALKAESAKTQGFVLETSSSQEVLDAD